MKNTFIFNPLEGKLNISREVPKRTTSISITGSIGTGGTYDVTASGVDYTTAGDTGTLLSSAAAMNADEKISIYLNGVYMIKGTDAVWATATTFVLNQAVDSGDEIIVIG